MAEYENHRMLTLQFRELAAFGSMVSKFVVGKERPGHDIGSHNGRSFRCVATCFSDAGWTPSVIARCLDVHYCCADGASLFELLMCVDQLIKAINVRWVDLEDSRLYGVEEIG